MTWIILSIIYSITNAVYGSFNEQRHYNGYVLGIWRGFGISFLIFPLSFTIHFPTSATYYLILIIQGILIGIYDSHIFFASSKYGRHASSGFMATSVLITTFLWWGIDFSDLITLLSTPQKLITLLITLCGFSISYWQMMKVHINREAVIYLYPAVFSLSLMSIATRYIAIKGGSVYTGVICYLLISCFVSGIYNTIMFYFQKVENKNQHKTSKKELLLSPLKHWQGIWLITFSTILITAKTLALRIADNPGYVVAMLMLSPMFSDIIHKQKIIITPATFLVILFLSLLVYTVNL